MKKKPKSYKKTTGTYICYKIRYYIKLIIGKNVL